MHLFICMFFLLVPSLSAQDCQQIQDDAIVYKTFNTPEDFCLKVENGFNILFEVESVETSKKSLDHLLIKQGSNLDDDGNGFIFAHKLKEKQSFLTFSSAAFVKFDVADDNLESSKASINYRRVGKEIITTTKSPTTISPWPKPSANDSIYYSVHISGYSYESYKNEEVRIAFRESVAKMAQEYVLTNNFPIIKDITYENVLMYELKMCDLELPESKSCAVITFALPIIMDETVYSGYELKESHISLMWERYSGKYLEERGFANYKVPDLESATIGWSTIVAIVIILLMACIVIGMFIYPRVMRRKMIRARGDSSTNIGVINNKGKHSFGSMHDIEVPSMYDDFNADFEEDDPIDTWVGGNKHS